MRNPSPHVKPPECIREGWTENRTEREGASGVRIKVCVGPIRDRAAWVRTPLRAGAHGEARKRLVQVAAALLRINRARARHGYNRTAGT